MNYIKENPNIILIAGAITIALRLIFPVYECAVPQITYSSKLCQKGKAVSFALRAPEHQTEEFGKVSLYKPNGFRTYTQALAAGLISWVLYSITKTKRRDANISNNSSSKNIRVGFLQRLEQYLTKRETEDIADFKTTPARLLIMKTLAVPAVALGFKIGGGTTETATYMTGFVFVVTMNYVHNILQRGQWSKQQKRFANATLLGSLALAIIIIAL